MPTTGRYTLESSWELSWLAREGFLFLQRRGERSSAEVCDGCFKITTGLRVVFLNGSKEPI